MQIPSNVEIISNENLDNMILVQIPKTKFAILGEKNKSQNWNVSIISKIGNAKRKISQNTREKEFAILISKILSHPEQEFFKGGITLTNLKNHYKLLLKRIKHRQ